MLAFIGAIIRIVLGFLAACFAASFVQVLFAVTPAELVVAGEARWTAALNWGMLSTIYFAYFAAPFALIAVAIGEWSGIRSFAYYAIVAMAIAVGGFGLISYTEVPAEASIVNSYAMAAYLTSGFVAGLVYWLLSGRKAWRRADRDDDDDLLLLERTAPPPGTVPATGSAGVPKSGTRPAAVPRPGVTVPPPPSRSLPDRLEQGAPRPVGSAPVADATPGRTASSDQARPPQPSAVPQSGQPPRQRPPAPHETGTKSS